jgi:hypothetical protein
MVELLLCMLGHTTKGLRCVWMSKVLVTNMKGPKQVWVAKNNA